MGVTRGGRAAACVVALVMAGGLAAGCSAPRRQVAKPPGVVVPGVLPGSGSAAAGGSAAAKGSSVRYGPAGSRGVVVLGGWAPGGAGNPVAAGALAYFRWLNARGGVYGRKIVYRVLDDHGQSRVVASLAHRLVQGEAVFAVFGAQGPQGRSVTGLMDAAGVPDVFAGWSCSCLASARYPEVFGWPVTDGREAAVLGGFAARRYAGERVAVVSGPGRAGVRAFARAARGVRIAARETMAGPSSAPAVVAAARAAGARVLVVLASSADARALRAAAAAGHVRLRLVAARFGQVSALPGGVVTDSFLPAAAAPAGSAAGSWIALFRRVRARYARSLPLSPAVIDGMASAFEMAAALFRAGPDLTRQGLVTAMDGLPPGPAVVPLAYSPGDHGGARGAYAGMNAGSGLTLLVSAAGTVSVYSRPQRHAPADGVPAR